MSALRLTKPVRRGLTYIISRAQADYAADLSDESPSCRTKREQGEIERAFEWLRSQTYAKGNPHK